MINIVPMKPSHWEAVAAIYQEGIDTGCATFETSPPASFESWDKAHMASCRFVAVAVAELDGNGTPSVKTDNNDKTATTTTNDDGNGENTNANNSASTTTTAGMTALDHHNQQAAEQRCITACTTLTHWCHTTGADATRRHVCLVEGGALTLAADSLRATSRTSGRLEQAANTALLAMVQGVQQKQKQLVFEAKQQQQRPRRR